MLLSQEDNIPELKEFTQNDLVTLLNELYCIAAKSKTFGLQLGVSNSDICNITANIADCREQLREILAHRLCQLPHFTWLDVIQALQSNAVQEGALAENIGRRYIPHLFPAATPKSVVAISPFPLPTSGPASVNTGGNYYNL